MDLKLPKMIADDYEPHFSLKHMFKDVQLGIHMANALDLEVPATTVTAGVMYGALNKGWADLDFASVFKLYDDSLGKRRSEEDATTSAVPAQLETTNLKVPTPSATGALPSRRPPRDAHSRRQNRQRRSTPWRWWKRCPQTRNQPA